MERKMETTIMGYIGGIMERKMETTIMGYIEIIGYMGVKIMVPFGIPIILRHLLFRVPKKGP